MTRKCQKCGKPVSQEVDFCPHCGARSNRSDNEWINKVLAYANQRIRNEGAWR